MSILPPESSTTPKSPQIHCSEPFDIPFKQFLRLRSHNYKRLVFDENFTAPTATWSYPEVEEDCVSFLEPFEHENRKTNSDLLSTYVPHRSAAVPAYLFEK